MQETPPVQEAAIQPPWTTQVPLSIPLGRRSTKRKRSASPSTSTSRRTAPNSVNQDRQPEGYVSDTFSGDDELWAEPITTDIPQHVDARVDGQNVEDEEESDGPTESPVARRLDFNSMRRATTPTRNGLSLPTATQNALEDNGANPFLETPSTLGRRRASETNGSTPTQNSQTFTPSTSRTTSSASLLTSGTASSESFALLSQMEAFIPLFNNTLPDLRRQISRLEQKRVADARSIEAKNKRIAVLQKEIEERGLENERLKKENKLLKEGRGTG